MRYTGIESIDERIKEKIEAARKREYFMPRKLDECNKLIPELEEVVKDFKNALEPYRISFWDNALNTAWDAARGVANYYARNAAFDDTRHAALIAALVAALNAARDAGDAIRGAVLDAALDTILKVAGDASWEVIRDIEGYENNPFEKIVKIYDMGLYPRGFGKVDGIEKFIVDFPLKTDELGCWAEGDKEILYKHNWNENCSKIRPVKPLEIIKPLRIIEYRIKFFSIDEDNIEYKFSL